MNIFGVEDFLKTETYYTFQCYKFLEFHDTFEPYIGYDSCYKCLCNKQP